MSRRGHTRPNPGVFSPWAMQVVGRKKQDAADQREHAARVRAPKLPKPYKASAHETWRCGRTREFTRPSHSHDQKSCDQCGRCRAECEGLAPHGPARPGEVEA